jgi:hypothetical protein
VCKTFLKLQEMMMAMQDLIAHTNGAGLGEMERWLIGWPHVVQGDMQ